MRATEHSWTLARAELKVMCNMTNFQGKSQMISWLFSHNCMPFHSSVFCLWQLPAFGFQAHQNVCKKYQRTNTTLNTGIYLHKEWAAHSSKAGGSSAGVQKCNGALLLIIPHRKICPTYEYSINTAAAFDSWLLYLYDASTQHECMYLCTCIHVP